MSISDENVLLGLISRLESGELLSHVHQTVVFESEQAKLEVKEAADQSRFFGGAVVPALKVMLAQWISTRETKERLASELAAPMLTKRIISWLPIIALAIAQFMGFDVLGSIASELVLLSLAIGSAMLWFSHRWCTSIIAKAVPRDDQTILELGRVLIALNAGATWSQVRATGVLGQQTEQSLRGAISSSRIRGAPLKALVESEIGVRRNSWLVSAQSSIREASVRLSLPMGLAMLPALVFLVVIPVFSSITNSSQGLT